MGFRVFILADAYFRFVSAMVADELAAPNAFPHFFEQYARPFIRKESF
jgi:hypothetical protein